MARENHPTINGFDPDYGGGRAGNVMSELDEEIYRLDELAREYQNKQKQANSALDTFFTKYQRVEDTEANKVTRLGWKGTKPTTVICDLDGTLCDINHRLHYVKNEDKKKNRWDLFNKYVRMDSLYVWCAELLRSLVVNHKIVYCSGRVDNCRRDTEEWIEHFQLNFHDNLFMRHRQDFRQDYIIKEIILDFEILPRYNVLFAIDDRQQVVDMWRRRGITCLQCAPGDF